MVKRYKHIFFDLDRTLWDFDSNSREALSEIYDKFNLCDLGIENQDAFISQYIVVNEKMWDAYRKGSLSKETLRSERFLNTLRLFDIDQEELASEIGDYYIWASPRKTGLFPGTKEVLSYLKKKYPLHIITNGFDEVQHLKLAHSGLSSFFEEIITSEYCNAKKPNPKIFHYALEKAGALASESIMIGDDIPVDLHGAKQVGIDTVYFNPNYLTHDEKMTYEVNHLRELCKFL